MFTEVFNQGIEQLMRQHHNYKFSKYGMVIVAGGMAFIVVAWVVAVAVALLGIYGFWAFAGYVTLLINSMFFFRQISKRINSLVVMQSGQAKQISLLIDSISGLSRKTHNIQNFLQRTITRTTDKTKIIH